MSELFRNLPHGEIRTLTPETFPISRYAYHIYIPKSLDKTAPVRLLVWGHGSSIVDCSQKQLLEETKEPLHIIASELEAYGFIGITPVLPRMRAPGYKYMDLQMLGRETMLSTAPSEYKRPDKDILHTALFLQNFLRAEGYLVPPKFFIGGASAGAALANRFSLLHPNVVAAQVLLSAGSFIYPEEIANGVALPYPYGINDLTLIDESRINKSLSLSVPTYIFVGEQDTNLLNDPIEFESIREKVLQEKLRQIFGDNQYLRTLSYADYLTSHETDIQLYTLADLGHQTDERVITSAFEFLQRHTG